MPKTTLVESYTLGGQTFKVGDYFRSVLGQNCRIIGIQADGRYSYSIRNGRKESVVVHSHIRDLVTAMACRAVVYGTLEESPIWFSLYSAQIAAAEARKTTPPEPPLVYESSERPDYGEY